jgi:hypothetical protein
VILGKRLKTTCYLFWKWKLKNSPDFTGPSLCVTLAVCTICWLKSQLWIQQKNKTHFVLCEIRKIPCGRMLLGVNIDVHIYLNVRCYGTVSGNKTRQQSRLKVSEFFSSQNFCVQLKLNGNCYISSKRGQFSTTCHQKQPAPFLCSKVFYSAVKTRFKKVHTV